LSVPDVVVCGGVYIVLTRVASLADTIAK